MSYFKAFEGYSLWTISRPINIVKPDQKHWTANWQHIFWLFHLLNFLINAHFTWRARFYEQWNMLSLVVHTCYKKVAIIAEKTTSWQYNFFFHASFLHIHHKKHFFFCLNKLNIGSAQKEAWWLLTAIRRISQKEFVNKLIWKYILVLIGKEWSNKKDIVL